MVGEPVETGGDPPRERPQFVQNASRAIVVGFCAVPEVGGQHEEGLDQREQQHRDDDGGDVDEDLPHDPWYEKHGRKGRDRRENRKRHGRGHLACAFHRGPQAPHAGFHFGVDVLAHDDRVIDHETQGDDQGEEADHVDGLSEYGHQCEGTHERDRDAERDPTCQPRFQEQSQQQNHEGEPHRRVAQQEIDPVGEDLGVVVEHCHGHAVG